jgi:hypothetical protein
MTTTRKKPGPKRKTKALAAEASAESVKTKRPAGRPTSHTAELAALICVRIADGESLRAICRDADMPNASTVHLWVIEDRGGFSKQYEDARLAQAMKWADELLDIADNGSNDWMSRNDEENAGYSVNGEHIQRSRLRCDNRKWLLSKVLPKVYGDKLDLNAKVTILPHESALSDLE